MSTSSWQDLIVFPFFSIFVDIEECALDLAGCHETRATCTNTPGSYMCNCINGFMGDGVTCTGNYYIVYVWVGAYSEKKWGILFMGSSFPGNVSIWRNFSGICRETLSFCT